MITNKLISNLKILTFLGVLCTFFTMPALAVGPILPRSQVTEQNINLIDQFGGRVYAVSTYAHYAYVGIGPRMVILDISNPTVPVFVGQTPILSTSITNIEIIGNHAYVMEKPDYNDDTTGGLRIYDISNPIIPVSIGFYNSPFIPVSVAVYGTYAYLADTNSLRILDISNLAAPTEVGYITTDPYTGGEILDVIIIGNYAYIAEKYNHGIRVLDLSNPAAPTTVYQNPSRAATHFALSGHYLYVSCHGQPWNGGMAVMDVRNPANPNEVYYYSAPEVYGSSVEIGGHYAYLYIEDDNSGFLRIFDITKPRYPELEGTLHPAGGDDSIVAQFTVYQNYLYVAALGNGLLIADVADNDAPIMIDRYALPSWPDSHAFALVGDYIYAGDTQTSQSISQPAGNIYIIHTAAPTAMPLAGVYRTRYAIDSISVSGNYAYIGEYNASGRLHIADVSNPLTPVEIGVYDAQKSSQGIYIRGTAIQYPYAYLLIENSHDEDYSMLVLDITNPSHPQKVGELTLEYLPYSIAVSNTYAYIVGYDQLNIVDISNPAAPTSVGTYGYPGNTIVISEPHAYIAHGNLSILDISNPTAPTPVGTPIPGSNDVTISEGLAYLTSESAVRVIDVSTPSRPTEIGRYDGVGGMNVLSKDTKIYVLNKNNGIYILEHFPPSQITGQVQDVAGTPLDNVTLTLNDTLTTTTDATGVYTLTNIVGGAYTLTASKPGILWWEPARRTVHVPPEATGQTFAGQDFIGHHIYKAATPSKSQVVKMNEAITYTLTLAYPTTQTVTLYDPIPFYTTYITDSLQSPIGITFNPHLQAITGTLTLSPTPIELSFAVKVGIAGTVTFSPPLANRACIMLPGQTISRCEWSNRVVTATYLWNTYLPFVIRTTN
ncbi:MAG: carboxypeptidase regulatory-like domain-containing protein [Anaerolineae bacterium]|nr:carboxypeptidase regulatory-like domain-containing protein [Anaerolineae bacterium]